MRPKLYEAAKSGDVDCLTQMLGYPHILIETTPKGNNLLHVAAQYKKAHFIRQLLAQCSSLGRSLLLQGNRKGDTPLHIAAKVGSLIISEIFMDFTKSFVSDVEGGQVEQQEQLLRMANLHKDTALHYAARYGSSSVAKLLIEEDPELCNITNDADESPLYLATVRGHGSTALMMFDASPPSSSHKGTSGRTVLHAALHFRSHSFDFVKTIVEGRPQMIRERDDNGWTPLHYAACIGSIEAVQLFLQHNVSVAYLLDNDGESALHIAALSGNINVIEEVIKSSPDACELTNNKGQTALHTAVIGRRLNVVKFILQMPSFEDLINEQDNDRNTAMHLAALHRQYNIIYLLAQDQRVDIMLTNKEHLTALGIFRDHRERGFRASNVYYVLKGWFGVQDVQDRAIKRVKRRLENQFVGSPSSTSATNMNNNMNKQEEIDPPKRSMLDVSLLVAVLIATVTFTAAFTVPGGFNNDGPEQGMATLAGKAAFKAFVVFNTTAFCFSVMPVFLQFDTSLGSDELRAGYAILAAISIYVAVLAMVLAFACGTCVVLSKTPGLGVFAYAMVGCFIISYIIGHLMDPRSLIGKRSFGRHFRRFLFHYVIR